MTTTFDLSLRLQTASASRSLKTFNTSAQKAGTSVDKVSKSASRASTSTSKYGKSSDRASTSTKRLTKNTSALWANLRKGAAVLGVAALGLFGLSQALGAVSRSTTAIFDRVKTVGSVFQTLGIQLETQFGATAAKVFDDIQRFALDSPGQVAGITASWIGLKSIGIDPTIESMRVLDDIASSSLNAATGQARKLEGLAEAIRGAITGDTERLKAFNIIAKQSGDFITLTFKDTEVRVKKNAEEIFEAIQKIGRVNFPGAARRQMNSLAGASSNLEDAIDSLASTLFNAGVGDLLTDITRGTNDYVSAITPGAVDATKKFVSVIRDLGIAAHEADIALGDVSGAGLVAGLFSLSGIDLSQLVSAAGALHAFSEGVRADRKAVDENREARIEWEAGLEKQQASIRTAIRSYSGSAKAIDKYKQSLIDANFVQVDTVKVLKDITKLQVAGKVQKLAEAWDKLLGEATPGIEVLSALAEEQIRNKTAADGAAEALKREKTAMEEQHEIAVKQVEAFHQLILARKRLMDLGPIQTIEAEDPTARGSRFIAEFRAQQEEAAALAGRRVGDEIVTAGGTMTIMMRDTGEDVGRGWARQMTIAGHEVGLTWVQALRGVISLLQDFGRKEQGRFGGNVSGDFASEGEQIGQVVGAVLAPFTFGISAVLGPVIGKLIGGAIKQGADEGLAELNQIGDEVVLSITKNEGGLGSVVAAVGQGIADALAGFESILQGQINIDPGGGGGFKFKVRDDEIFVMFAGMVSRGFETVQEAIDAGILMAIQHADISGASPEVQGALQNFAGSTIGELNATLAFALELQNARLGPAVAKVTNDIREIFGKLAAAIEAGIPIGGALALLEQTRASLLGLEVDIAAQKAAEIDAYNAALDMQALSIRGQILEIETLAAGVNARALSTQAYATETEHAITLDGLRIRSLANVTGAQAQMVAASAGLLLDLNQILQSIEGLRITGTERAAAIARAAAGRARGVSRGGTRQEDPTEALAEQLERMRAVSQAAFDFGLGLEELRERLERSNLSARDQAELLARVQDQFRESILAPFQEFLEDDSVAGRLAEIEAQAQAAREALAPVAHTLRDLEVIARGAAAEVAALAEQVGSAFRDQLSQTVGFLESLLPHISDSEQRAQIEGLIVQFAQDQFRLELLSHEAALTRLSTELQLLGLLDEATQAWLNDALAGLGIIRENFDEIMAAIGEQTALQFQPEPPTVQTQTGPTEAERVQEQLDAAIEAWRRFPFGSATLEALGLTDQLHQLQDAARAAGLSTVALEAAFRQRADDFIEAALAAPVSELDAINSKFADLRVAFIELGASSDQLRRLTALQAEEIDALRDPLRDLLADFRANDPRQSGEQAFQSAQEKFRVLEARVRAGDVGAIQELREAAIALIGPDGLGGITGDFLGQGVGSLAVRDEVIAALEELTGEGFNPDAVADPVVKEISHGNVLLAEIRDHLRGDRPAAAGSGRQRPDSAFRLNARPADAPLFTASAHVVDRNRLGGEVFIGPGGSPQTIIIERDVEHDDRVPVFLARIAAEARERRREEKAEAAARAAALAALVSTAERQAEVAGMQVTELQEMRRDARRNAPMAGQVN